MPAKPLDLFIKRLNGLLKGKSGAWLSRASGVSQPKISRILAGKNEPDLSDIFAFAKALGHEPGDLLFTPGAPTERSLKLEEAEAEIDLQSEVMGKMLVKMTKLEKEVEALKAELAKSEQSTIPEDILEELASGRTPFDSVRDFLGLPSKPASRKKSKSS